MKNVYSFDYLFCANKASEDKTLREINTIEDVQRRVQKEDEEDEQPQTLSEVFEKNNGISEKDFMTMHQNDNQSSSY